MSDLENILQSPCLFCGYNGENYWQEYSHKESCHFHPIGGIEERKRDLFVNVIPSLQSTIEDQEKTIRELEESRVFLHGERMAEIKRANALEEVVNEISAEIIPIKNFEGWQGMIFKKLQIMLTRINKGEGNEH